MRTAPTATISFFWDDRWKTWRVSASREGQQHVITRRVDTSSPIDREGLILILEAVAVEMLAWLY